MEFFFLSFWAFLSFFVATSFFFFGFPRAETQLRADIEEMSLGWGLKKKKAYNR
jgi:hypothetical protein